MAWTTTRRLPFTTYMPAAKRRRTEVKSKTRTLPVRRYAAPEIKQFISAGFLTSTANSATYSIPLFMNQGDNGDTFIGSKFRILRVRVYYDYRGLTPTTGIRMAMGIPKDPTQTLIMSATTGQSTLLPTNYFTTTLLKEKFLKTDDSDLNGYLEWTGPLNVEMDVSGATVQRNNLIFQVNSEGIGATIAGPSRTRIEVLFTG